MKTKAKAVINKKSTKSLLLLVSIFIFIFLLPIFEFKGNILPVVLFSIIILLAGYSISTRVALFGMGAILVEISTRTTDFIYLNYLAEVLTNIFLIYIVGHV